MRQQEAQLFGRCQQNVRRGMALALAARGGRIAGAGFHGDSQVHLSDRGVEIARHVHRQGLERRNIQRVQGAFA
jgi:hypothetical protein